ncbi:MAG: RNA-binding transcriptional accessory protein [Clostridiales bacterium]|nr:MAG: RNA-binding transcriptional accessory protein [Clostridiales bacterium]
MNIVNKIAKELDINERRVGAAVNLIDEGNTLPFIARYRKEMTGSLTDLELRSIDSKLTTYRNLERRREDIISSIESQDAMTPELLSSIEEASTLSELEDLYLPYKKKRNTRAGKAKKKGLEPLALKIYLQLDNFIPEKEAEAFIDEEVEVYTVEDALQGASDIIAEMVSDNADVRGAIRKFINDTGVLNSLSDDKEGTYALYSKFSERIKGIAPHRVLAINRGEKEGVLRTFITIDEERALEIVYRVLRLKDNKCGDFVRLAAEDAFNRLISPSLENEAFNKLFEQAAEQAISVFGLNLKPLLMQPPLTGEIVMGFDPAYRTGCKIAVVDSRGKLLDTAVVYPTPPQKKIAEAEKTLMDMIKKHSVSVIAIGNGTASKESEIFVSDLIKKLDGVRYAVVNEAGASVYSASVLGAEEFPSLDVSLRSAVSIARRLQDPLAELVKIDPKSIGVGQYQHDMPQKRLSEVLSAVVEDSVNSVGVDANTASASLLSYVAGIGPMLSKNIVAFRDEIGGFNSRKELLKVPKLGKKTYEQCAGFIRVANSKEFLDNTAVHPESYKATNKIIALCNYDKKKKVDFSDIDSRISSYGEEKIADEVGIGVITLKDIVKELKKPGRDPRESLEGIKLRSELLNPEDLVSGTILEGTVRNVVDFGVFVDIGVHQDGLVHISKICDKFLKHPSEVLKVGDIVKVKVEEVDLKRNRISLNMRDI